MRARILWVYAMALAASSCGGGVDPGAALCAEEAKKSLGDQVYKLDLAKLSATKTALADGNFGFKGEVILKPGTSGELLQTMDCVVAAASGDAPARVMNISFDFKGSGVVKTD